MLGRYEECRNKFEDIYNVEDEMNVSNLTWNSRSTFCEMQTGWPV